MIKILLCPLPIISAKDFATSFVKAIAHTTKIVSGKSSVKIELELSNICITHFDESSVKNILIF